MLTKLFNVIPSITSLKANSTILFLSLVFCFNIVDFTDFYFVFEDLFVERETPDMTTVSILQSMPGRFKQINST